MNERRLGRLLLDIVYFLGLFALTSDGVTKGSRTGQDEQENERDTR